MSRERRRIAHHEASHAVIALRLGVPLNLVSIAPTAAYGGACDFRGANRMLELDPNRTLVLQHARARRYTESMIRVALAGPVADALWWPSTGFVRSPKVIPRDARPNLPPVAAAQLVELEDLGNAPETQLAHDEDRAFTDAWLLVGSALAPAYFSWARADTAAMVADSLNVRAIERLADALLAHTAMAPRHVRAVVRGERT